MPRGRPRKVSIPDQDFNLHHPSPVHEKVFPPAPFITSPTLIQPVVKKRGRPKISVPIVLDLDAIAEPDPVAEIKKRGRKPKPPPPPPPILSIEQRLANIELWLRLRFALDGLQLDLNDTSKSSKIKHGLRIFWDDDNAAIACRYDSTVYHIAEFNPDLKNAVPLDQLIAKARKEVS